MATLRDCVRKMQENCGLTDDNDLDQLKQTTDQIGRSLAELKDATKVQAKFFFPLWIYIIVVLFQLFLVFFLSFFVFIFKVIFSK